MFLQRWRLQEILSLPVVRSPSAHGKVLIIHITQIRPQGTVCEARHAVKVCFRRKKWIFAVANVILWLVCSKWRVEVIFLQKKTHDSVCLTSQCTKNPRKSTFAGTYSCCIKTSSQSLQAWNAFHFLSQARNIVACLLLLLLIHWKCQNPHKTSDSYGTRHCGNQLQV